jgi:hypothetical protein
VAEEEEPQVHHSGWGPRPRGRKGARRWQRLGREAAWAASSLCQYWQTAVFTDFFHRDLVVGGEDHGVWEGVEEADLSDLAKPGVLEAVVEDVEGVAVEDVGGTQLCYHHQEAQLSHVEDAGSSLQV